MSDLVRRLMTEPDAFGYGDLQAIVFDPESTPVAMALAHEEMTRREVHAGIGDDDETEES